MILALLLLSLQAQTKFGTAVEVRVVNIDVVVTDKVGHRVTGLTKDDFEVLEDGKRQTITNFYEAHRAVIPSVSEGPGRPGGAPPVAPSSLANVRDDIQRRFVVFIDNDSLHPVVRKQFFAALRKFVDAQLRPGDQASVVSWNRSLQIAAPLTDDKAALLAAIDKVEATPSPSSAQSSLARVRQICIRNLDAVKSARMTMGTAYADCINSVRAETSVNVSDSRLLMNAVNVAMTLAAGAEGKKVFVLAGASLPKRPGWEMYRWANMLYGQMARSFDAPNAANSDEDDRQQRESIEKLARSANAHGFSLYTIDAPVAVDGMAIQSSGGGGDFGADFLRMENTEASFGTLSEMTGGLSIMRPADFSVALGTVAGDLDAYYSIGYKPADDVGRDRNVVVRVKNRDYTVRARQTYAPKTAEEQMSDRVIANIYAPAKSEWPVTIRAGAPEKGEKGSFTVPLEVSAPPSLTLLPEEGKLTGGFAVYVAVGNRQGQLSTLSRNLQPVAVPPGEEPNFRKIPIAFTIKLTLKPGENLVSVALLDQVGRVAGFARTTITTP